MSEISPCVSVVTPVYNGEHFISDNVRAILGALEELGRSFELIVVCDGSVDGTAACAEAVGDPRVRVLRYPVNQGKGHALLHGSAVAHGRLVAWLDSDLDIDPRFVVAAVTAFDHDPVDAVIGSKRHPASQVDYPWIRRFYSWGFQLLVRLLFRVKARDTQVGAKVFRRELIETVGPLLLVKRYAFDLEVLAVAAEFGFDRVQEAPIALSYRFSGSGINRDAVWRMFVDTLAIAYRIHIRHWYVRRFASLQRDRMDRRAQSDGAHTTAAEADHEQALLS
ncbi:MAG TPA: glycosyltransferase family 2 protein [Thermoleophilaceae bacterium]